ncbi:MAG TPA: transglutaminaseTgpA domain-containing protein [Moraxellaceae bacterium]|nr:transglutaminaseTgpA domain-containing protein [Moraxellaceae bacterium]
MDAHDQSITDRRLHACIWLALTLAAAGRSAVADGAGLGLLLAAFWGVINGIGLAYAAGQRNAVVTAQARRLSDRLAVLGLAAFLIQLMSGAGLVPSLLTLVLGALAAKNPVLQQRRDAHFALLGSLAVMMWAAGRSFDGAFVLLLVTYALAVLMALALLHQQKAQETTTHLLLTTEEGRRTGYSWRHLAMVGAVVLAGAAVWYLLVPRPAAVHYGVVADNGGNDYRNDAWDEASERAAAGEGARHHDKSSVPDRNDATRQAKSPAEPRDNPDDSNGGSDEPDPEVSLDKKDTVDGNPLVLIVQADRPLYLRQKSFDTFDGKRWAESHPAIRYRQLQHDGALSIRTAAPGTGKWRSINYSVQVVRGLPTRALPLSADLRDLHFPARTVAVGSDGSIQAPRFLRAHTLYSAVSDLPADSDRLVLTDAVAPDERFLQLPAEFTPAMRELAATAAGSGSPLARATAIEHYLRSHYTYSQQNALASQGVTPMQDFLFGSRRGHCEYFATAMALFLRAQGIPARVVHGYSADNFNPVTGYYEVHRFDGHAWAEGYIAGQGWATFEATPAYALPTRAERSNVTLAALDRYARQTVAQQKLLGLHDWKEAASQVLREMTAAWNGLLLAVSAAMAALSAWSTEHAIALAGLILALAMIGLAMWKLRYRIRYVLVLIGLTLPSRKSLSLRAVRGLSYIAGGACIGSGSSETLDAFLERIAGADPTRVEAAQRLAERANVDCYSGRSVRTSDAVERAEIRRDFRILGVEIEIQN